MCGIAGIINLETQPPPRQGELEAMLAPLHHRGPDGTGTKLFDAVGLAHARLSIIDLAGGAQPIHNEDGTVWVVFNGEIFNYVELRAELEKAGHRFYTHSDTEVLVHLYEEHGLAFAHALNGQFAIALYDTRVQRLVLVRDRPGILPLFVMRQGKRLAFASEVKALLPLMPSGPRLDPLALDQLMTFWAPVSPRTMFEGVEEVGPGEMLVIERGRIERKAYWQWSFPTADDYYPHGVERAAEELEALLTDAVRLRLRADVPVGAYLSGGLDSSVLASLIHADGAARLRTFSIGFNDSGLDESAHQAAMVRHLKAEHSRIQCAEGDIAAQFPRTVWHAESPMLRTAPVPMQMLSGLVREQGFKVVLTGEGADEVLGGYDLFKEAKIRRFWSRNRGSRWRPLLLRRLYPYLELAQQKGAYLEAFFGVGLEAPELAYFSHLPRWTTTAKCKEFLAGDLRASLRADAYTALNAALPRSIAQWHAFNRGQFIEARSLMAGYLLSSQGDRMLMANSVEGRFPYLDHRLIEFANRLPPGFKMRVLNEKFLLKKAMAKRLPATILQRAKQPYRAPNIPAFFGAKAPAYVDELLSDSALRDSGYFDVARVGLLVKKIKAGRAIGNNDNMALVGILSTQLWHQMFVSGRAHNFGVAPSATFSPGDVACR